MLLSEYSKKTLFIFSSSILIVVIIFCSPFLKQMIEFIHWQTIVASRPPGSRPGDHTFMELLNPHHWTATYWGFFGISVANLTLSKIISLLGVLLGTILFFLMLTGQYIFFQEKKFNFLSVGFLLFCATLWMIIYNHYSYGAYKLILISWWLMTYGVAVSVDYWINRKKYLKIGFGIISIVYISLTLFTMLSFNKSPTVIKNMTSYRELINVQKIIGSNPVMVSVTDNYSNIWAVYYLRDAHIYLTEYKLYMADHTSLMTRSEIQKKADIHFLLTDNNASLPIRNLIWSNKYFYLWKLPPHWAIVKDVINKNGIESWDDKIAFWLGDGDTIFNIMTNYSGNATFSANFSIGPSLKNKTTVQLLITNKNNNFKKYLTIAHPTTLSISVPVKKGNNILILRALDKANNLMTTDPRPMLIGVRNLH